MTYVIGAVLFAIGVLIFMVAAYEKIEQTHKLTEKIWERLQRGYTTQKDVGK